MKPIGEIEEKLASKAEPILGKTLEKTRKTLEKTRKILEKY